MEYGDRGLNVFLGLLDLVTKVRVLGLRLLTHVKVSVRCIFKG